MLRRVLATFLLSASLHGCDGDADVVATPYPIGCGKVEILLRRGIPENLVDILAGSCRAVRTPNMRGPDYTIWLAGLRSQSKNCDSPLALLWTEEAPDGTITAVNFCEDLCRSLRRSLEEQLAQDVACPNAGAAGSGAVNATAGAPAP